MASNSRAVSVASELRILGTGGDGLHVHLELHLVLVNLPYKKIGLQQLEVGVGLPCLWSRDLLRRGVGCHRADAGSIIRQADLDLVRWDAGKILPRRTELVEPEVRLERAGLGVQGRQVVARASPRRVGRLRQLGECVLTGGGDLGFPFRHVDCAVLLQ